MSKFTFAGLASLFIGAVLIAFQVIGALISTGGDLVWKNLTLMDIIGKTQLSWIEGMSEGIIQDIVQYIVTMQLFLLLICVGILFLILGQLTSRL
jgi:hypothetical protein